MGPFGVSRGRIHFTVHNNVIRLKLTQIRGCLRMKVMIAGLTLLPQSYISTIPLQVNNNIKNLLYVGPWDCICLNWDAGSCASIQ